MLWNWLGMPSPTIHLTDESRAVSAASRRRDGIGSSLLNDEDNTPAAPWTASTQIGVGE